MDEIPRCYHSNETSSAVLSHGTICLVCSSNFESVDEILWCYHSNETSSAVLSHGTIYLVVVVQTSESVDESTRHADIIQNCNNDYIYSLPCTVTQISEHRKFSYHFFKHALSTFFTSVESLAEVSAPF